MQQTKTSKILSLLLAVCLVGGLMPVISIPALAASGGNLVVQGGNGADGTDEGTAGTESVQDNSDTAWDNITITGGDGGIGVSGGTAGGKGGKAELTLSASTVNVSGDVTVVSGNGGDTNPASHSNNDPGTGGSAILIAENLIVSGSVLVQTGSDGDNNTGAWCGVPQLRVDGTLMAPSITVESTQNNATYSLYVKTLDVSVDTTITAIGGMTAGNCGFETVNIADGKTLTVDCTDGGMVLGQVNFTGNGTGRIVIIGDSSKLRSTELSFFHRDAFDIPASTVGTPTTSIDVSVGVITGQFVTTPYTFSATGLPEGISIDSGTGVISGTPTEPCAAGTATIMVTDSDGDGPVSKSITINYGAVTAGGGTITGTMNIGGLSSVSLAEDHNSTNCSSSGHNHTPTGWTWTASTATLALTSDYSGSNYIDISCAETDTINLEYAGDVSIESHLNSILCDGNLNVSGSGTLSLTSSGFSGLSVEGDVDISSDTLVATSLNGNPGYGIWSQNADITISGTASVTATGSGSGGRGVHANTYDKSVTISTSGTVVADGGTGENSVGIDATNVVIENGNVTAKGYWGIVNAQTQINVPITVSGRSTAFANSTQNIASGLEITSWSKNADGSNTESGPIDWNTAKYVEIGAAAGGSGATINISTVVNGIVYGNSANTDGTDYNLDPDGNTLNINNGGTVETAYGAYAHNMNGAASATGNTVNVNSGGKVTFAGAIGAHAYSSDDDAAVSGNFVNVAAGGEANGASGGNAQSNSAEATTSNNTVTINGAITGNSVNGGATNGQTAATAYDNSVIINSGAVVNGRINGGVASTVNGLASALNNSITINGGTVNGDVIGGDVFSNDTYAANNNIITIKGGTVSGGLYGGRLQLNLGSGDLITGNTLNLHSMLSVTDVENFENLNFYLPSTISNGATMLTTTTAADLTGVAVDVKFDSTAPSLAAGDIITLIDGVTGTFANKSVTIGSLTLDLSVSGGKLIATVPGGTTTYTVTVNNGTANPTTAEEGETVNIAANAPATGRQFKEWTVDNGGAALANKDNAITSFTMPANAVTVTATYMDLPATTYSITVQNDGNGTANADVNSAKENDTITLTATPNSAYQFKEWQVIEGGVTIAGNSFTMPDENVTVKAIFERIPAINISAAAVSGVNANYTYTGSEIKPTPVIKLSGTTLTANTDYTVAYSNNISVGTATITITGIGNYTGTKTVTFTIRSSGGGNSGDSGGSSGTTPPTTPSTPTTPDTGDNTVTTPKGQDPVTDKDGNTTLPGGGTITTDSGTNVEAPTGTTIDKDGNVTIPDDKEAHITLPGGDEITLPGGSTIDGNGNITVGGDTQVKLSENKTLDIPKGSTITEDGKVTVGAGGATLNNGGIRLHLEENTVIIFDTDTPLGYSVQFSNPFTDVPSDAWYYNSVSFVYNHGLFKGTSSNTFSPNAPMTRAMLATVLARLGSADLSGYENSRFADVTLGTWYTQSIEWAVEKGIVSGMSNDTFSPNAPITREQLAVMIYNFAKAYDILLPSDDKDTFADEGDISAWAQEAVKALQAAGIINGKPSNLFDPQGNATRAEVASMLERFVQLIMGE